MKIKPLGTCPALPHKLATKRGAVMDNRKARRYFQQLKNWFKIAHQRLAFLQDIDLGQNAQQSAIQSIAECLDDTRMHLDWLKQNGYPNERIEEQFNKLDQHLRKLVEGDDYDCP